MFFIYLTLYSIIDIINIPYDRGANIRGSSKAFNSIKPYLNNLNIDKIYNIETNLNTESRLKSNRILFGNGYVQHQSILNTEKLPLLIGGDHTCAISSIFSSNNKCILNDKKLGVLWFDAHADFNTIETSITGNLHGTPVAILCGHTLPSLNFGFNLYPSQFAYYGVRDIDSLEFTRFTDYNMNIVDNENMLIDWCNNYDYIHLSFDMDCIDSKDISSVNTPVKNGPRLKEVINMLKVVKNTNKLMSMDLVEYNPDMGDNPDIVIEILETVLL